MTSGIHDDKDATITPIRPALSRALDPELAAIDVALDAFVIEMRAKLHHKAAKGWRGWDSRGFESLIVSRLIAKANLVEFDRPQAIDIANMAMMLWYQKRQENKS